MEEGIEEETDNGEECSPEGEGDEDGEDDDADSEAESPSPREEVMADDLLFSWPSI